MDISRIIVVLLAATTFTNAASAAEFDAGSEDGIAFLQLDYPGNSLPVPNSSVGRLQANLLTLRANSGISSGYINVVLDDE